jgi:hypothetical protein
MFKLKALTALTVTAIFGLAACGGGSSDKNDSTVTTVRQKNAALSYTTLPATTAPRLSLTTTIAPLPGQKFQPNGSIPNTAPSTTSYNVPGMGTATTMPCLPPKKPVGPVCK